MVELLYSLFLQSYTRIDNYKNATTNALARASMTVNEGNNNNADRTDINGGNDTWTSLHDVDANANESLSA